MRDCALKQDRQLCPKLRQLIRLQVPYHPCKTSQWVSGIGLSAFHARALRERSLTWKSSPAPSQSAADMMGVCRYWNPACWKNSCVAKARALLTLIAAPIYRRGSLWQGVYFTQRGRSWDGWNHCWSIMILQVNFNALNKWPDSLPWGGLREIWAILL